MMQVMKFPSKDGEVVVEISVTCPVCGGHINQDGQNIKLKCKWCVAQRIAKIPNTILRPEEIRYCNWCAKLIEFGSGRSLYCSEKCACRYCNTSITVKNCEECGAKFMQKRASQRFCTRKCSRKFTDRVPAIFRNMRFRCESPKSAVYKNYGGKGIRVRLTYEQFEKMYLAAEICPLCQEEFTEDTAKMKSIDRIDSDGDYHLENCRITCRSCNSKRAKQDD